MCGIVGIIRPGAAAERARVEGARDRMIARGPDAAGLWSDANSCLAMRRLAVIDLSPGGHQPFVSEDGTRSLVFNGEIYNFRALREELRRSIGFRSSSDTEVILRGYETWGWARTLERLDGMFAIALWDARSGVLHAARDRMGKKPFFYTVTGGAFRFASTLEALVSLLDQRPDVDPAALDQYLVHQTIAPPRSVYRGVHQLLPAHTLQWRIGEGAPVAHPYWSLSYAKKIRVTREEAIDEIDRLGRRAVRQRLESDVPLGVFLSGGVDSSLVTAWAAQESAHPPEAFALGFLDPAADERPHARRVARHLGVALHEEVLAPRAVHELPRIVHAFGQPLADVSIVPNWCLARAARRRMTVVLNGDGGDEVFGGYARPLLARWSAVWRACLPDPLREQLGGLLGARISGPLRKLGQLARDGSRSAEGAFVYDRAFRLLRAQAYGPALDPSADPDQHYRALWRAADGPDDHDRALFGDLRGYLPDQLLPKADVCSMAHSLEARSPLLDRAVVEFAATLPSAIVTPAFRTKSLLKALAARYVPPEVLYRRKRGFTMPAGRWLRGPLKAHLEAVLRSPAFRERGWILPAFAERLQAEHQSGSRDWGEQLWTLLVLELWARTTIDGTLAPDAPLDDLLGATPPSRLRTVQLGMEWQDEYPGGLNRVVQALAEHLPAAGVDPVVLVAGAAELEARTHGLVRGFAPPSASALTRVGRAEAALDQELARSPTAIVASHFAPYGLPLALRRRPYVVHFHGPWGAEAAAGGVSAFGAGWRSLVERLVYRRAAVFVVLSEAFGTLLEQQYGVPADRIRIIPGGADVERFLSAPDRATSRAALGWSPTAPIVLSVRRLERRMGLDRLIDAAAELRVRVPAAEIVIIGDGAERGALERRAASAGVADVVRFLGRVSESTLVLAYRAATLTVVPSLALEGFGLVVPESLAAGTPVLVSPVGGLPETVRGLSASLILPDVTARTLSTEIAGALTGLRPVPTSEACTTWAREQFSWQVMAQRTAALYESLW